MDSAQHEDFTDAGIADNPDIKVFAGFARHVLCDLHDISERLARIEAAVEEFAPLARAYAGRRSMSAFRGMGKGKA
jgi:hypothetical protein